MNMKRFMALVLATVMLLTLCACGKDKKKEKKKESDKASHQVAELLPGEVGRLTIYCDNPVQVIYDKSGKVLGLAGNETLVNACSITDKDYAVIITELLDLICDQNLAPTRTCILLRQEPNSETPNDKYLDTILEAAKLNKGEYPIIVTAASDLDEEGLFDQKTALAVLRASVPDLDGYSVNCDTEPVGGSYTAYCTNADGVTVEYSIVATDGSVIIVEPKEEAEDLDADPWADIPESDIIDPITDAEMIAGADGGVDDGSVDFN